MRFPWRRKRKATFEGSPFVSKKRLAQYLGNLAMATFNGEISEGEARACEKIIVDFFQLLNIRDFALELGDTIEPQQNREKLAYAS